MVSGYRGGGFSDDADTDRGVGRGDAVPRISGMRVADVRRRVPAGAAGGGTILYHPHGDGLYLCRLVAVVGIGE